SRLPRRAGAGRPGASVDRRRYQSRATRGSGEEPRRALAPHAGNLGQWIGARQLRYSILEARRGVASGSSTSTTAMRGLLVSDLHDELKQFDWVQAAAGGFDLVVIAGDSLDISSYVAVEAQIVVVSKYLRRMAQRTRLITSSGNHDLNARGAN